SGDHWVRSDGPVASIAHRLIKIAPPILSSCDKFRHWFVTVFLRTQTRADLFQMEPLVPDLLPSRAPSQEFHSHAYLRTDRYGGVTRVLSDRTTLNSHPRHTSGAHTHAHGDEPADYGRRDHAQEHAGRVRRHAAALRTCERRRVRRAWRRV